MIMHQWSAILIHEKMNASIYMNLRQNMYFIKRQKNLDMLIMIMSVHTVSTVIGHHMKPEWQHSSLTIFFSHKCYKNACPLQSSISSGKIDSSTC